MKKIFLTTVAVLGFAVAGAQTNPSTTPVPQGNKPVKTDVMEKNEREMQPKADGLSKEQQQNDPGAIQPPVVKTTTREPVTTDHVKSTPVVNGGRDTTTVSKPRKTKKQ
jgi:hypothetical protein